MTTDTTTVLTKSIFYLLRTRTINYGTNLRNPYYIHSLVNSVPKKWSFAPIALPFSDLIRLVNGNLRYFWNEDNLIFDWEMMHIFHKKYVNDADNTDPLSMYLSILTAVYVLCFKSFKEDGQLMMGTDMKQALQKYQKVPPLNVDLIFSLGSDHSDFKRVAGNSFGGVTKLIPHHFNSFNIINKLQDPELGHYVRDTYGAQLDPAVKGYDAAHFWISHFQTVYNFYRRWHDKK